MKLLEVQSTKDFASTFLNDIFFKMAVNRVLDAAPGFELVYCKDCKWCSVDNDVIRVCNHPCGYVSGGMGGLFFCAGGERKTE